MTTIYDRLTSLGIHDDEITNLRDTFGDALDEDMLQDVLRNLTEPKNALIDELHRQGDAILSMQVSRCSLYLTVNINGKDVDCLLDTGAQTSVIDNKLVEELGIGDYVDRRYVGTMQGVGEGKIIGIIPYIETSIDGLVCQMCFTVLENERGITKTCILGLPFMLYYQTSLDFEKRTIKIQGIEKKLFIKDC